MVALLRHREHAPVAVPAKPERHLRLVPPPEQPSSEERRRVHEARWTSALVAVATLALVVLWAAAARGAADAAWWGPLLVGVLAGVVGFGIAVTRITR